MKLPRMNGLRGEQEKEYIERTGLLEVGNFEEMSEEMREKVFIEEFHKMLQEAEEKKFIVSGLSKIWNGIKNTWTKINFDFGWRFDAYTRAMALINKAVADGWERPTAGSVKVPTVQTSHSKTILTSYLASKFPKLMRAGVTSRAFPISRRVQS